jgi:tetratricopeptide (TPR) repeat protein
MQRVLEIDEANFDALNFIGYDWAERGIRLDEAELYIREALFLRPGDGNIMDSLAWVLFRQGRFEEALAIQLDVVARAPDNAVLQDHLGDILFALERWDEALQAWEYALQYATEYDEDVLDTVPAKIERVRELLGR